MESGHSTELGAVEGVAVRRHGHTQRPACMDMERGQRFCPLVSNRSAVDDTSVHGAGADVAAHRRVGATPAQMPEVPTDVSFWCRGRCGGGDMVSIMAWHSSWLS